MKLTKPSAFFAPHLIYDPIKKGAIVVDYDQLVTLPGPYANHDDAHVAWREFLRRDIDAGKRSRAK